MSDLVDPATYLKVRALCMGSRLGNGDKKLQAWEMLDGPEAGSVKAWTKPIAKHARAGGVYELSFDGDSVMVGGQHMPRYVGPLDDQEKRLRVELLDRDHTQHHAAIRAEKRAQGQTAMRDVLLPLRKLVHGAPGGYAEKAGMITAITAELWRPLTKEEREA